MHPYGPEPEGRKNVERSLRTNEKTKKTKKDAKNRSGGESWPHPVLKKDAKPNNAKTQKLEKRRAA